MIKVAFYSYKGGAGRSTTLWNTIQRLVKIMKPTTKEPFVIVDTDTESAGVTILYKAEDVFFNDSRYPSVQRRMVDREDINYSKAADIEKERYFRNMHPVGSFFGLPENEERAVLLIGANLDRESAKDADIAGDSADSGEQIKRFSENITKACAACGAKALFFDTPAGTQFLARRSVLESDIVVCCMRPTIQFLHGTRRQLINFANQDNDLNKLGKRHYVLTPTAVCMDGDQRFIIAGESRAYPARAREEIKMAFEVANMEEPDDVKNTFAENVKLDMLEPTPEECRQYPDSDDNAAVFGVPEIKRFKWFEACLGNLPDAELSSNDKMAINRYEYLAHTILKYAKKQ